MEIDSLVQSHRFFDWLAVCTEQIWKRGWWMDLVRSILIKLFLYKMIELIDVIG